MYTCVYNLAETLTRQRKCGRICGIHFCSDAPPELQSVISCTICSPYFRWKGQNTFNLLDYFFIIKAKHPREKKNMPVSDLRGDGHLSKS